MELGPEFLLQFGMMQRLSTGSSLLDTMLVMLLPVFFSTLMPYLKEQWGALRARWAQQTTDYVRRITFAYPAVYYDYSSSIAPNHKLHAAILLHLNRMPGLQEQFGEADVNLIKASSKAYSYSRYDDDASSEESIPWYEDSELQRFEIKLLPPCDQVIKLKPGLQFCRSEQKETIGEGNNKSEKTTVTFTLSGSSAEDVDSFIAAAYDSYREGLLQNVTANKGVEKRYLYLPVLSSEEEENFTFRAYPLTDGRDFSNFFHPEREEILKLVESFNNKTGKFSIKGYPHKLGFLLHGPPGTGKTTFLKALAAHTKRSIVNIPLERIKTNQQLMSLMMDQRLRVQGQSTCRPLPHSQVIYVCEDVDCASHVVRKRGAQDPLAAALHSLAQQSATSSKPYAKQIKALEGTIGPEKGFSSRGDDRLSLAGLLNILDGVVDTPGRLLVFSSNHPETLDPALIRPGRINKQVYMGYMRLGEALQLVRHYFGDVSSQQEHEFGQVWCEERVTPAALESLCAECEDVHSLVQAVAVLVSHLAEQPMKQVAEQPGLENACMKDVLQPCGDNGSVQVMVRSSSSSSSLSSLSSSSSSTISAISSSSSSDAALYSTAEIQPMKRGAEMQPAKKESFLSFVLVHTSALVTCHACYSVGRLLCSACCRLLVTVFHSVLTPRQRSRGAPSTGVSSRD